MHARTLWVGIVVAALIACDDGGGEATEVGAGGADSGGGIGLDDPGLDAGSSGSGGDGTGGMPAAADAAPAEPDAGGGEMPDAGGPEPDAGPPAPMGLCAPCSADGSCGTPGAICLTNQNTMEQFCGVDCTDGTCPWGSTCFDLGNGAFQCAPSNATCEGWPPSDLGRPCGDDPAVCATEATACAEAGDAQYCTRECATVADCPVGYGRCLEGLCQADWTAGPEGCGLGAGAGLPGCDGGACPDGLACREDGPRPVCTRACASDDDCADLGGRCATTADGGRVCLDVACACMERDPDGLYDAALALAGLDRCSAIFTRESLDVFTPALRNDPWRLSWFNVVHDQPSGSIPWSRAVDARLAGAAEGGAPLSALINEGAALLDRPIAAEVAAAPEPDADAPLLEALRQMWADAGQPDQFVENDVLRDLADVPPEVQRAAARVALAAARVPAIRDATFTDLGIPRDFQQALWDFLPGRMVVLPEFVSIRFDLPVLQTLLNADYDYAAIYGAARDLAWVVESTDWAGIAGLEGFRFSQPTPWGLLVLQDAGAQTLEGEAPVFLLLDVGGDDTYHAPVGGSASLDHPVALAIDLGGNDRYGYPEMDAENPHEGLLPAADAAGRYDGSHPQIADAFGPVSFSRAARQGGAVLGVGLLFDLGGDDVYHSLKLSQGAAVMGVGAHYDADGADTYLCEQACQGAAAFGIGISVDRGDGIDSRRGVQNVQAYGDIRAFGYLYDGGGDDTYTALLGDAELGGLHLYPNAQNEGRSNTSMSQAAASGRRGDAAGDGVFASGGLAVLHDAGGDDTYTVDVFGQGSGFWFGTAIFHDAGGADAYDGRWYNQGSGAHYALNVFLEGGGNDRYNQAVPILATAVGQGHDYTFGALIDFGGDDTWLAPGLGMGAGNDNGIGFLFDAGGDDTYEAPDGRTFGGTAIGDRGNAIFDDFLCLGVFVDADGTDTYPEFAQADEAAVGDGRAWSWGDRRDASKGGERGAGIDALGGVLGLPIIAPPTPVPPVPVPLPAVD